MNEASTDDRAAWLEVREILDEELARLPPKYRAPLVMCDLEGNTHEEAARRLDRPQGSISWLLARAREQLRRRLSRRGISGAALPALTSVLALARADTIPSWLLDATARAAAVYASGAPILGMVSAWALRLAQASSRRGGLLGILLFALLGGTALAGLASFPPTIAPAHEGPPAKVVLPVAGGSANGLAACSAPTPANPTQP